jgi:hypothetical protein
MLTSVMKWTLYLFAALMLGPIVAQLLRGLNDSTGGHAVSLLSNTSPVSGVIAGVITLLVAGVLGVVGSRACGTACGMLMAGLVTGWPAWSLGRLWDFAYLPDPRPPMMLFAFENFLVMVPACIISIACMKAGRIRREWDRGNLFATESVRGELPDMKLILASIGLATIASFLATMFVAVSPLKGQTIAGAVAGGMAAGLVSQQVVAARRSLLTPLAPMIGMTLVAVLSPVIASIIHGSQLATAISAGKVIGIARPLSLEWVTGAFLGVSAGLSWTAGAVDHRASEEGAASATS